MERTGGPRPPQAMIDDEMVAFLTEQLETFSADQLGRHLKEEGNDPLTVEESLKEAMRLRALRAPRPAPDAEISISPDEPEEPPVPAVIEMKVPMRPKDPKRQLRIWAAAAVLVLGLGALLVRSARRSDALRPPSPESFKDRKAPRWEEMWKSDEAGGAPAGADYAEALARAEKGDAEGQYQAGVLLQEGRGGASQDDEKGAEWLSQAAAQGHLEAQFRLGFTMERGVGGSPNYALAAKWYQQAAERGHTQAQINLGYIYFMGLLGLPDIESARGWWERAAAAGSARAMAAMGQIYAGAPPNSERLARSYMWNVMAFRRGGATGEHIAVQQAQGMLDRLKKRLTPRQVARAEADARRALAASPQAP